MEEGDYFCSWYFSFLTILDRRSGRLRSRLVVGFLGKVSVHCCGNGLCRTSSVYG